MLLDGPEVVLGALWRRGSTLRRPWVGSAAGLPARGRWACRCLVGSRTRTDQSVRDGLVGVHRGACRLRPAGASRGHDTRRLHAALCVSLW